MKRLNINISDKEYKLLVAERKRIILNGGHVPTVTEIVREAIVKQYSSSTEIVNNIPAPIESVEIKEDLPKKEKVEIPSWDEITF